jgi:hypothetical protein
MSRFRFLIASAVGCCAAIAVWGPFGFRSDWVGFLLGLFVVIPTLVTLSIVCLIAALLVRTNETRRRLLSFSLAAFLTGSTIVAVWMAGRAIDDQTRYAVWSVTHPQELNRARHHDGIFMHWDSWGMVATGDFDSYLVSDRSPNFSNALFLRDWMHQRNKDCIAPDVRPIDAGIYIITTLNCDTLSNDIDITKD